MRVLNFGLIPILAAAMTIPVVCRASSKPEVQPATVYRQCVVAAAMHYPRPATSAIKIAQDAVATCEPQAQAMRASLTQGVDATMAAARVEASEIALKAAEAMHKSRLGM